MSPLLDAPLRTWNWEPWLFFSLGTTALLYLRGWRLLRRTNPGEFTGLRLTCFCSGLAAILLALVSPLDALGEWRLSLHMLQHLLLMMVAPPLIWLGAPALPLLRGLPGYMQREWIGPFLRPGPVQTVLHLFAHPVICWGVPVLTIWLWHVPALYEKALAQAAWHEAEHASFLMAGLLFWWPVVQPYPSVARWSRWAMIPYLLLADVQNTIFSAIFCFSPTVIYAHYAQLPHDAGSNPLTDQAIAGAIMWIPGSVLFLLPVAWLLMSLLRGASHARATVLTVGATVSDLNSSPKKTWRRAPLDLLRPRFLNRVARWRHTRTLVQVAMLLLAAAVVFDGFTGPSLAPTNLAGVLPWTHWRGFTVLALLAVGNLFCFACPFTLPRQLLGRWLPAGRNLPRPLRSKWIAVALVIIYLGCYEVFGLWSSPFWTAWLVVGYFGAALTVETAFRRGSFCKYVCPIGQFHFVQSLVSPFELRPREMATCQSCASHACLQGTSQQSGCQMNLFLPQKQGNLDCTLCLDCVRACPANNIGLLPILPASDLTRDEPRSGVGRWSLRPDIAALVVVLAFGAFANAAGMVGPVLEWQDRVAARLGIPAAIFVAIVFAIEVIFLPLLLFAGVTTLTRFGGAAYRSAREVFCRDAMCLVPIGVAMWIVHFGFHLATSVGTVIPVTQRFLTDLHLATFAAPDWQCGCCAAPPGWLLKSEMLVLGLGLLLSLHTLYRLGNRTTLRQRIATMLPWGTLVVAFYLLGLWIIFQPMQMRGTMLATG
ncbi:MAG: cytochrome c oxidase assembly protein [Pirellulales bacterium]|nr:cytochrome c oxidase assembly protein [Pirellulales bacterium]